MVRSFPSDSSCRHEDRTISSLILRVWRMVSEDSRQSLLDCYNPSEIDRSFLLITRTLGLLLSPYFVTSTWGYSGFPAYSQICYRNYSGPFYSYGRRLLGLRLSASSPKGLTVLLNLPAPGRCQSLYVVLRLSRDMCF